MKYVILFGVLLAVFFSVPASVDAGNYVLRGGYYWSNGVAYTRSPCVIGGVPSYRYTVVQNVSNRTINNYPKKDWKVEVIAQLQRQQDNAAYLEALSVLRGKSYAAAAYGGGTYQFNSAGVSGQTIYNGFNASAFYGQADLNQLYQALAHTTGQAQDLAGTAASAHADLVGQAANAQAAVAVILAKAQSDTAVLQAAKETVTRTVTSTATSGAGTNTGTGQFPGQPLTPPVASGPPAQAEDALARLVQAKCLQCHGGGKKEGGLDLTKDEISDGEWAKVLARVNATDPSKVMPRDATGKAAPLTAAEKALFK